MLTGRSSEGRIKWFLR